MDIITGAVKSVLGGGEGRFVNSTNDRNKTDRMGMLSLPPDSDPSFRESVEPFFGPVIPSNVVPVNDKGSKIEGIHAPWREYEEPERATSKPLIPTMITNDELDKLRRKYLRMRAEISGLTLKEVGLSEDVDGDGEGDYLDVIDKLSPDTIELLDQLLAEEEYDEEAVILTDPGITSDAIQLIDSIVANLPAAVSSLVDEDEELPILEFPEEIIDDVKLAADTVDAVEGIATSQLGIGPVPTLSEINSWTSVYGRLKDKWSKWQRNDYYTEMEYTFDALREFMHNMDWLQGLMIIAALEARASYDPYFRLSFPKILQESKWFLPKKMYKLVPKYRPYSPPVPLVRSHFTVSRKDSDEKVKKKKNKKSYLKKLIGLRRMGTAESGYWPLQYSSDQSRNRRPLPRPAESFRTATGNNRKVDIQSIN